MTANGQTNNEPLISLNRVSKLYPNGNAQTTALNHITLRIYPGDFVAITGPSGCGKSTLLSILGLMSRASSGEYWLQQQKTNGFSDELCAYTRNLMFGFIFQSFHLIPQLSVRENVRLPLTYHNQYNRQQQQEKVFECLKSLGLTQKSEHYPSQLSGGQQQRCAIARALINEPKVLFADEPTGNLDADNSQIIMSELVSLNQRGITIILVTHDPGELLHADYQLLMENGRLTAPEGRR